MIGFLNNCVKGCVLYLIFLLVSGHAHSVWRISSPLPYPSPHLFSASVGGACNAAGSWFYGQFGSGPAEANVVSWQLDEITATNIDELMACRYGITYEDHEGEQYDGSGVIFAQYISVFNDTGNSCHNTSNPINTGNGNKFYSVVDVNSSITINRYYNSFSTVWGFDFLQRLYVLPYSNIVSALRPDGQVYEFLESTNGSYISQSDPSLNLYFSNDSYRLSLPSNIEEIYDLNGYLQVVNDRERLTSISHSEDQVTISRDGYYLNYEVDGGKVLSISDQTGVLVQYGYNSNAKINLLEEVVYGDSSTLNYLYEDDRYPLFITGIVDENGNRISSVVYDDQGRAVSSEKGPLGSGIERTQIQYNSDGTRTVTNALGKQSTYHFTQFNGEYKITQVEGHPSANCVGANQAYTYDDNGFMASKTDWQGNITTYIHNDRGQELSRTEASGTPQARTITTEWHAEFNLPVRVIEPERETVMTYDVNGRLLNREIRELQQ